MQKIVGPPPFKGLTFTPKAYQGGIPGGGLNEYQQHEPDACRDEVRETALVTMTIELVRGTIMPFTVEQFFDVFKNYNTAIWPAQLFAYALGIVTVTMALRDTRVGSRVVSAILAAFWIWIGIFYHIIHFSRVNEAARVFGALFILEGLLIIIAGCFLSKLRFRFAKKTNPLIGAIFITYAMVLYPLIGLLSGHTYPSCPMFGVTPCPGTIFTFGIFLWAARPIPFYVIIIPFLWSLVGVSAAINLQVPQDYGLGIAGVLGLILVLIKNRRIKQNSTTA